LNKLHYKTFGKPDVPNEFSEHKGLYVDKHNNIYVFGTANYLGSYWANEPNWLLLAKTDSTLNKKWEKYIGGDAYYVAHDLTTCSDGGIMISASRLDYNAGSYDIDVYILKLDSAGNLVTGISQTSPHQQKVSVYPNPAINTLHIGVPPDMESVEIRFFDSMGRNVLNLSQVEGQQNIDISGFPQGLYGYGIYKRGVFVESGKLVKQ